METTYKIIGGDGAEYGPATLDELRDWIRDGRVASMTQVWRSDIAHWSPAARYAELNNELAKLDASVAVAARPCGFWARLAAHLVDAVIVVAVFQAIWWQLPLSHQWALPNFPAVLDEATFQKFVQDTRIWANHAMVVYYPVYFLYDVLLNGRFGATVGKMLIGARIVLLDGEPIGYLRAAMRWLAQRISDLAFFAGYLVIALRRDKRALHDLLVGTRVIYKR